jgi:hypothetical protein
MKYLVAAIGWTSAELVVTKFVLFSSSYTFNEEYFVFKQIFTIMGRRSWY